MEKKRGKKQGKRRRDRPGETTGGFQNLRYFHAEKKRNNVSIVKLSSPATMRQFNASASEQKASSLTSLSIQYSKQAQHNVMFTSAIDEKLQKEE